MIRGRIQIPENDVLSRSKIFKNNTLSLNFLKENCVLPWKFVGNLSENAAILPFEKPKSHLCGANGIQLRYIVGYGPCHGVVYKK